MGQVSSRWRISFWRVALFGSLTGCGLVAGLPDWRLDTQAADGAAADGASKDGGVLEDARSLEDGPMSADAADADATGLVCDPLAPFQPSKPLTELNTSVLDIGARFTADELTVYFGSDRLGGSPPNEQKIFFAKRTSLTAPFGTPVPVPELDVPNFGEYSPTLTEDGLTLFLTLYDGTPSIYASTRASTSLPFSTPQAVPSMGNLFHPYVTQPGLRLLVTNGQTISEAVLASPTQAPTSFTPVPFTGIPSGGFQIPVMSADRKTFYGTNNGLIWRSHRVSDAVPFPAPVVVPELNEANANNGALYLSADNCRIYLGRITAANGPDLFVAERAKTVPGSD